VTQQYLIGQFSALLGDLQRPPGECLAETVHDLRREVESSPFAMLPVLAREAMSLTDMICWVALERGDSSGFCRYAKVAVALGEFTDSAGLVGDWRPWLSPSSAVGGHSGAGFGVDARWLRGFRVGARRKAWAHT